MKKTLKLVISMTVIISMLTTTLFSTNVSAQIFRRNDTTYFSGDFSGTVVDITSDGMIVYDNPNTERIYYGGDCEIRFTQVSTGYILRFQAKPNKSGSIIDEFSTYDISDYLIESNYSMDKLVAVNLGIDVKTVGTSAFANCANLKGATIASPVNIKANAFKNSGLSEIIIQNGVTGMGEKVFENCSSLEKVVICGSLKSIDTNAFVLGNDRKFELHVLPDVSLSGINLDNCTVVRDVEAVKVDPTCTEDGYTAYKYNGVEYYVSTLPMTYHYYDKNCICKKCNYKLSAEDYRDFTLGTDRRFVFDGATGITFKLVDVEEEVWSKGPDILRADGENAKLTFKIVNTKQKTSKELGRKNDAVYTFYDIECEVTGDFVRIIHHENSPFMLENVTPVYSGSTGSVLSEGSTTIVVGVLAAAVFGLGGYILGRKRKKTATEGAKETDEE